MLLPGGGGFSISRAATLDLFVCSEMYGWVQSSHSGGRVPPVELIGFHVSRLQFQVLHPARTKIGVNGVLTFQRSTFEAAATPKWGV